jgi:hypothetical protein
MLAALFLPDPTALQVEHVAVEEDQITLTVRTTPGVRSRPVRGAHTGASRPPLSAPGCRTEPSASRPTPGAR